MSSNAQIHQFAFIYVIYTPRLGMSVFHKIRLAVAQSNISPQLGFSTSAASLLDFAVSPAIRSIEGIQSTGSVTRIWSVLATLSDSVWFAVPKRKVSPHRRGNRNANKHIRFVPVVSQCSKCEKIFEQHSMPSRCKHDDCPAFNLRAKPNSVQKS